MNRRPLMKYLTVSTLATLSICVAATNANASDVSSGPGNAVKTPVTNQFSQGTFEFPRDDDWYKVYLNKGDEYAIEAQPDQQLDIGLYSPSRSLIATEHVGSDFDSGIEYRATTTGWFFVKLLELSSEEYPASYQFRVSTDCGSGINTSCKLKVGVDQNRQFAFSWDEDWYRMNLDARNYTITFDTVGGCADLDIRGSDGSVISSYWNGCRPLTVQYSPTVPGTYYVSVAGDDDSGHKYTLSLTQQTARR
jgi:hypothetical protein